MSAESEFRAALANLPAPDPRPESEAEELKRIWAPPKGWRLLTAVNNTYIGVFYVGAALLFFVLAGILALLMRAQLAAPLNDLIGQDTYNQFFTMHGTMMMFLFAVPAVEAMGVLLLPQMLAARDLPFPRLSAYAFWAYLVGGLAFFGSLFFGAAPDGGWFMYPPLTSSEYSPGINADMWLLGIGFIEISAIAGAIEIVVGILKTRAPGMGLDKLPLFAWAMLVFAGMIIVGFPAIILGTLLLEMERAFGWPFFMSELGGDPLLWQHLFWFFGHPEVYIIFLPAAGFMSMIVPVVAQAKMVGYRLVVLALIATGFISFGVWVHHMFATGLPNISVSFFSAASMAVSIPAGIQVFAWIATLASAPKRIGFTVPALFTIGFLVTFTMGGLTGVMVAMVPFDWQVHDTYFIVAHLHYVLIGGMVFPLFAAIYYWTPMTSMKALSERVGRWVFGLIFTGMHVAFLPMHLTGLMGMPRRVYTYLPEMGVGGVNLLSTAGAFLIGAGVLLFLIDMSRNFRFSPADGNAGNVYNGGTMEWLPSGNYAVRSIPYVTSRDPVWDQPSLGEEVEQGRWFLPNAPTGRRETIVTSPLKAIPQYLMILPGPSWWPVLAAVFTAAFFLLLTVKFVFVAALCGVLAVAAVLRWAWDLDEKPLDGPVDVGGGLKLPVYMTGPMSHSWWAMVVLMIVIGMIFTCLIFSYLYLWSVQPGRWPPPGAAVPDIAWLLVPAFLYAAAAVALQMTSRRLATSLQVPGVVVALLCILGAFATDLATQWQAGLRAPDSSYAATVYAVIALQGLILFALLPMAGFVLARMRRGRLNAVHRVSFDNLRLLFFYAVGQGLIGLLVVRLFPSVSG